MRRIAENILDAMNAGRDLVLVTVAKHAGSTPRHTGSQLLASGNGLVCGTIGGGAVEGRAISVSQEMLGESSYRFEDLLLPKKGSKGLGMACGGAVNLLYSPVNCGDEDWCQVASEILNCYEQRIPSFLILDCPEGGQPAEGLQSAEDPEPAEGLQSIEDLQPVTARVALVTADGALLAGAADLVPENFAGADATQGFFADGCFVMPVQLPTRAIIFGGGHVGRATAAALSNIGFACTVFDCRPEFAQPGRFPFAQKVILGDYQNIAASLELCEDDYVFIMTHGHDGDYAILEQVLRQPLAYVGLMGSKKKIAVGRQLMLEAGISQETLDTVHMPIGLAIQAETPEEIAISIAAECIQHRASR